MANEGGIYFDLDYVALRSFDELMAGEYELVCGYEVEGLQLLLSSSHFST